jgi:hypothetical protein
MNSDDYAVKAKAAVSALKSYQEKPFVPHEWEELVVQLSRSNDPRLREMMYLELDAIRQKEPFFRVF